MKEIDKNKLIFLILSFSFLILFIISSLIMTPTGSGAYHLMFVNLIFGGWEGFILIMVSMIKVIKGYEKVKSAFKIYIVGLVLIIFNFLSY